MGDVVRVVSSGKMWWDHTLSLSVDRRSVPCSMSIIQLLVWEWLARRVVEGYMSVDGLPDGVMIGMTVHKMCAGRETRQLVRLVR